MEASAPSERCSAEKHSPAEEAVVRFFGEVSAEGLPAEVVAQGRRCLLDLIGVAAGGFLTPQATIVREHVAAEEGDAPGAGGALRRGARILFDGRRVSLPASAWAGATAIESLDAHDGHSLTKGHAGVALLPAVLAACERRPSPLEGSELLLSLVEGYEVAIRCGLALHATALDYHSSGAWNGVAVALVSSRLLGGGPDEMLHAAGIAEYFGPRGPMMRCIAAPSMVKDSSAWGCRVGVEAALLAAGGFTGRPAELLRGPVGGAGRLAETEQLAAELFSDLGERWRILELYFKPHPVCRWAQPAVEAALALAKEHAVAVQEVDHVEIGTFGQAVALSTREPRDTEEAQYSLPFAVAAALSFGRLSPSEVGGAALFDPETLRLSRGAVLREVGSYSSRFPAERLADVVITLRDGRRLSLEGAVCRGDPSSPLSEEEMTAKFRLLADPLLGRERAAAIEEAVAALGERDEPAGTGARLQELLLEGVA